MSEILLLNDLKSQKARECSRRWRTNHLDRARKLDREWRLNNPDKARESGRKYRETHKEERRTYRLKYSERHVEYSRKYRQSHPEQVKARRAAKIAADPEKYRAINRKWHEKNKTQTLSGTLLRRYGISLEGYEEMLCGQGGVCAICGTADWGKRRGRIDHDHKTGKIRGILCNCCNVALGMLKENPILAQSLIDYIKKHGGVNVR